MYVTFWDQCGQFQMMYAVKKKKKNSLPCAQRIQTIMAERTALGCLFAVC